MECTTSTHRLALPACFLRLPKQRCVQTQARREGACVGAQATEYARCEQYGQERNTLKSPGATVTRKTLNVCASTLPQHPSIANNMQEKQFQALSHSNSTETSTPVALALTITLAAAIPLPVPLVVLVVDLAVGDAAHVSRPVSAARASQACVREASERTHGRPGVSSSISARPSARDLICVLGKGKNTENVILATSSRH